VSRRWVDGVAAAFAAGARLMIRRFVAAMLLALFAGVAGVAGASPAVWERAWPRTDFSKTSIDFAEVISGGPPKDGIPSIDEPAFVAGSAEVDIGPDAGDHAGDRRRRPRLSVPRSDVA